MAKKILEKTRTKENLSLRTTPSSGKSKKFYLIFAANKNIFKIKFKINFFSSKFEISFVVTKKHVTFFEIKNCSWKVIVCFRCTFK